MYIHVILHVNIHCTCTVHSFFLSHHRLLVHVYLVIVVVLYMYMYMYIHLLEVTKQQTCMSVISKLVT